MEKNMSDRNGLSQRAKNIVPSGTIAINARVFEMVSPISIRLSRQSRGLYGRWKRIRRATTRFRG